MHQILTHFPVKGNPIAITPVGGGHINHTYRVDTDAGECFTLQSINGSVFQDIPGLMNNIQRVTAHLVRQVDDPRRHLTLIPTLDGQPFYQAEGKAWRMYEFIRGSVCLQAAETPRDLEGSGEAFGAFQTQLADFPAEQLIETIPHFHDTPDRFRIFREAIAENRAGRLDSVRDEVERYLRREKDADGLTRLHLPLRVTHNDTKLTNVMFDAETREPLCVVDLDTVMPGLVANDFGDAIRFGASTAAEDETDLSRVHFSLELYEAFARGFLRGCGAFLTPEEKETLPLGARLMTLECGVRFLTDYLNGDAYFAVHREHQNLDRARTQLRLVEEMEAAFPRMCEIVRGL